jgi:hypothetical protein
MDYIKYLEKEIKELQEMNNLLVSAAASSPFGNSVGLDKEVQKFKDGLEDRVRLNLWQKSLIKACGVIIEDLSKLKKERYGENRQA